MQLITIRMRRIILFVLLYAFLMPFCASYMQAGTVLEPPQAIVSGIVTDTSGVPLAGVNLVVESKNIGTISDLDGSFTINAGPTDVLIFSMVGFKTLSVPIGGREEVNVSLEEDVTVLGEVVLNAGYYTVSEKEGTGNIATIKAGIIDKQPVGNPLAAMQGHLSGVNIVQSSGVPGGGFEIEVRGRNFINGVSDPLFIVDGVPFGSQSMGSTDVSGQIFSGNISPLNAINPNADRFQIVVWDQLIDTNDYLIVNKQRLKERLRWFEADAVEIQRVLDYETQIAKYAAYTQYTTAWTDWRVGIKATVT